jgi:hypothetical protein
VPKLLKVALTLRVRCLIREGKNFVKRGDLLVEAHHAERDGYFV